MPQHKMTTEEFKNKIFSKYGDKVEILSEYNGGTKNIDILYHCEKHGDIYKTIHAKNITSKSFQPCDLCSSERKSKAGKGKKIKDKKYYYNKLKNKIESKGGTLLTKQYTKAKDNYEIICENGHKFIATADSLHSKDQWCPYCSGRNGNFEEEIDSIIKNKNGTLLSHYINSITHLKVKCNTHNYEWYITPSNLKKGRWCPICNLPYSEKTVYDYLINNKYIVEVQYSFKDLKSKNDSLLKFDFAILDKQNNVLGLIEVDDNEHRYNTKQLRRLKARKRDRMKDDYCTRNNIELFRLEYDFYKYKEILKYDWYYKYIHRELSGFLNNITYQDIKISKEVINI